MRNPISMIFALFVLVSPYATAQEIIPAVLQEERAVSEPSASRVDGIGNMENVRFRAIRRDKLGKVRILMDRPHIQDDRIYLRVRLHNRSAISYDVDFFRFYIRDRKTSRRTITQEQEIVPAFSYVRSQRVNARSKESFVFVMDKFTLADKKVLRAEVFEKAGGRHFQLQFRDGELNKARFSGGNYKAREQGGARHTTRNKINSHFAIRESRNAN